MRFCYARYCTSLQVWDCWWNEEEDEETVDQKVVSVQGSPCVPIPLTLILLRSTWDVVCKCKISGSCDGASEDDWLSSETLCCVVSQKLANISGVLTSSIIKS
jgi:hypothetical protein